MMWAVSVFEGWDYGGWEFVGYVKVFRSQDAALDFAYKNTESAFHARYYRVEALTEEQVRAGGLEDLIES